MKTWQHSNSNFHIHSRCCYFETGLREVIVSMLSYLQNMPIHNFFILHLINKEDFDFFFQRQHQIIYSNVEWVIFADEKMPVYHFLENYYNVRIIKTSLPLKEIKLTLNIIFKHTQTNSNIINSSVIDDRLAKLTPTEYTVSRGILEGISVNKLADRLCCTPKKISYYKRRIMEKLSIKNISSLNWLIEPASESHQLNN